MVSNWFPMNLILESPLHVPGFVHEDGRLYSNQETQRYGERLVREGRQAREERGQVFVVESDWNAVQALMEERHRRATLAGPSVRVRPQFASYHD